MISLCFYLIILSIVLPSGSLGIKLEILLIIPMAIYSMAQLLLTNKKLPLPSFSTGYLVLICALTLPIVLLLTAFVSSGKIIFFNLLMILFVLIFLFGYSNYSRIISLVTSKLFSQLLLLASVAITFQSFTSVSSDGWDTLGSASGSVIARASIGVFESNSLSIACSGLVALLLFSINNKYRAYSSNLKSAYYSTLYFCIFLLTISNLRTFSRTGLVAGLLALLASIIPLVTRKLYNSLLKLKISNKILLSSVLCFSIAIFVMRFIPFLNFDLLSILISRASFASLTYDARFEIWHDVITSNDEFLFLGKGFFVFSDNFLLSQIFSNGLFLGILITLFSLAPFICLFFISYHKRRYTSTAVYFASLYLASSALIYAMTSDFIGQSKTLPILYLTAGLLTRSYSYKSER